MNNLVSVSGLKRRKDKPEKKEEVTKKPTSIGGMILGAGKSIVKGLATPFVKTAVTGAAALDASWKTLTGDSEGADRVLENGYDIKYFGKVEPMKIGASFKDGKQEDNILGFNKNTIKTMAVGAEVGLTFAGGGTAFTGAKTVGKQVLTQGAKSVSSRQIAKGFLADFAIGSSTGVAVRLQDDEYTVGDLAKDAAIGGAFGVIAPRALGKATSVMGAGMGKVAKKGGKSLRTTSDNLKHILEKAEARGVGTRYYERKAIQYTPKERFAQFAVPLIDKSLEVPLKFKRAWLTSYAAVGGIARMAKEQGKKIDDIEGAMQMSRGTGAGQALEKATALANMVKEYGDSWKYVNELSLLLDDLDRLQLGNPIDGGRSVHDVKREINDLLGSLSETDQIKIQDGVVRLQKMYKQELQEDLEAELTDRVELEAIMRDHEHYIPADRVDFDNEDYRYLMGGGGASKSKSTRESGMKKAKGSERKRKQDVAVVSFQYFFKRAILRENNRATTSVIDACNIVDKASPLRLAKNVKERKAIFSKLKETREQLQDAYRATKHLQQGSEKQTAKLNALNKKLEEQEDALFKEVQALRGKYDSDEIESLYQEALTARHHLEMSKSIEEGKAFPEGEMEIGYQEFKKQANLHPSIRDTTYDIEGLRKKFKKLDVDQTFFASPYMREDEMFEAFKKRYKAEAQARAEMKDLAKKGGKRFIKKVEKQKGKTAKAGARVAMTDADIAVENAVKTDIDGFADQLNGQIEMIRSARKEMRAFAKELKDADVKQIDYVKEGYDKVSRMVDGEREDWLVPKDVAWAIKNLDPEESGAILKWINNSTLGKISTAAADILRSLATVSNPMFVLMKNPARDIQTAKFTTDMAFSDIGKTLLKTVSGRLKSDEHYNLALRHGSFFGNIFNEGKNPEQVAQELLSRKGIFKKMTSPLKMIQAAGSAMEEMTRLAVFKSALKQGLSPREAAKIAKNSTVDFSRSGTVMQYVNRFVPFLNARVQGMANLAQRLKDNPTEAYRQLMWTGAVPAAMIYVHNNRYESYKNIPAHEKEMYWIIMIGESEGEHFDGTKKKIPHYLAIPKGEPQQVAASIIDRVMSYADQEDPESTAEFATRLAGNLTPVAGSDLIPPGAKQAIELTTNYNFFRESQIIPDWVKVEGKSFRPEEVERRHRSAYTTSEVAKHLGDVLNQSPAQIDYLLDVGILRDIKNVVDLGSKKTREKMLSNPDMSTLQKASSLPGVSTFVRSKSYGQYLAEKEKKREEKIQENKAKIEKLRKKNDTKSEQGGAIPGLMKIKK